MSHNAVPHGKQFAALAQSAHEATNRLGVRSESILLAGLRLNIHFAGDYLHDSMMRAFRHVITSAGGELPPDVTVWDEAGSGVPLPPEIGSASDHRAIGLGRLADDGDVVSFYDTDSGSLSFLDRAQGRALLWISDASVLAERHRAAPLQTILTWWLPLQGRPVVHAAAVGTEAGAVLLCGASGSGKSTTALACLRDGFAYLSDDLCAVTIGEGVMVHSLYCTGKLFSHHLADFPAFADVVSNPQSLATEKAIAYLTEDRSAKVGGSLPLRAAIVVASKVEGSPALRRVPPLKVLLAIGPSTLHSFPGFGREGFAGQAAILARVPCFEMDLSRDIEANPKALRTLLERAP
jgi:hypothetical protein